MQHRKRRFHILRKQLRINKLRKVCGIYSFPHRKVIELKKPL
jgi:hypothetical protein